MSVCVCVCIGEGGWLSNLRCEFNLHAIPEVSPEFTTEAWISAVVSGLPAPLEVSWDLPAEMCSEVMKNGSRNRAWLAFPVEMILV